MSYNLELLTKDLESSKSDRLMIHEELKKHDERLDTHAEKLVEHTQQIKTLFRKHLDKNRKKMNKDDLT